MREETGLDITKMLVEEDRIERHIKQQRSKLFIIAGVQPFFSLHCFTIVLIAQEMPDMAKGAALDVSPTNKLQFLSCCLACAWQGKVHCSGHSKLQLVLICVWKKLRQA